MQISLRRIFSIFRKFAAIIFNRVITKKLAKLANFLKSAKPVKILIKDGRRGTILKLIIPPNLLKQESVCLIPPTQGWLHAEHPSIKQSKEKSQLFLNKNIHPFLFIRSTYIFKKASSYSKFFLTLFKSLFCFLFTASKRPKKALLLKCRWFL